MADAREEEQERLANEAAALLLELINRAEVARKTGKHFSEVCIKPEENDGK